MDERARKLSPMWRAILTKDKNGRIDPECQVMCKAINSLPGLRTIESCSGHGESEFHIWFLCDAKNLRSLAIVAYWLMSCHGGNPDWTLQVVTDCGTSGPWFLLEGSTGDKAYSEANAIADRIISDVKGGDVT